MNRVETQAIQAAIQSDTKPAWGTVPGLSYDTDKCTPQEWAEILCQFQDATCEQSWAFGEDKWGEQRLSHLVVRLDGEVIAAAQVILLLAPVLNRGIAYLKMGPVWQRKGQDVNTDVLYLALDALKREYQDRRKLMLMVLLPPDPL